MNDAAEHDAGTCPTCGWADCIGRLDYEDCAFPAIDLRFLAPLRLDPDPLTVIPDEPDLTDIATHASGVWLTALVVAAGAFFVAAYLWSRSA